MVTTVVRRDFHRVFVVAAREEQRLAGIEDGYDGVTGTGWPLLRETSKCRCDVGGSRWSENLLPTRVAAAMVDEGLSCSFLRLLNMV